MNNKILLDIVDDKHHIISLLKGSSTLNYGNYLLILKPINKIYNDNEIIEIFSSENVIDNLNNELNYLNIQIIDGKKNKFKYKYKKYKQKYLSLKDKF